jgi:hypothetical protein
MKHLVIVLVLLGAFVLNAQDKVKFDGQIRSRYELNNKDFNSKIDPLSYTLLRTRFGALFTPSENVSAYIQFQDARNFGEAENTTDDRESTDLHQGYLKVSKIFDSNFSLQAGRMSIGLGNQRFIGLSDWGFAGRSFDGAIINHSSENLVIDLFGFKLNERNNRGDTNDLNLYGAFATITSVENLAIKTFLFWQKGVPTDNMNRWTIGIDLVGNIGNLTYEPEFAYQFGKMNYRYPAIPLDRYNKKIDIAALFAALNLTYQFEGNLQPKLNAGIEYFSGDDPTTPDKDESFFNLYPSNHKLYGISDIIGNMPQSTFSSGLIDMHLRFSFIPVKDFTFNAEIYSFMADKNYRLNKTAGESKDLGMETDFYIDYKYDKNILFNMGFALFSTGEIFKDIFSGDPATYFYTGLQLSL